MNTDSLETTSIDNFQLKWRWTDENYLQMPEWDLAKTHPLTEKSACYCFEESLRLINVNNIKDVENGIPLQAEDAM